MTTAFVLSGGGSLGAVHAGMLLSLAGHGVVPDLVVGTSVGAINACYLASAAWPDSAVALAELWCRVRRRQVFPMSLSGTLLGAAGQRNHVVREGPLQRLLAEHLSGVRLESAALPVHVVATEVSTGAEVVLSEGSAVQAAMASAAIPGVLPPVVVGGRTLFDGGLVNNTPLSVAVELGADQVYVLPTGYACALERQPRSALGMALHAITLALQRRLIDDVRRYRGCVELRVAPPLCPLDVAPTDFSRSEALVRRARAATSAWLEVPAVADQSDDLAFHRHLP
jgi:NTE family protein